MHEVIPVLHKQWRLSFDLNPSGTINGWGSIIHLTIGENNSVYGDRTPGIWFYPDTTRLYITSAVNGNKDYQTGTDAIPLNDWTHVVVTQFFKSDRCHYRISVDGFVVHECYNNDPQEFDNVKVSSS